MDDSSARALARLNKEFYDKNAASFSASRQRGWDGWNRVIRHFGADAQRFSIIDVACGNLRFARYLHDTMPQCDFDITCLDSCRELAGPCVPGTRFEQVDIIESLLCGAPLAQGGYDAAVSFGFMHHVPTFELRASLLRELLGQVRGGGLVAVSFWKFADHEGLADRARKTTAEGVAQLGLRLEDGDYLLGWDERPGTYRYCHSFTDAEIDALLGEVGALGTIAERFSADGRNGALNGYAVIRRR